MAQALNIARWLNISVTEGSADAFVEGSASTDIVPEDGLILRVTAIWVNFVTGWSALAADARADWSVTRDTKTAIADLSDPDSILCDGFGFAITTSGSSVIPQTFRYDDLTGIYLVEPLVYFQLDGSATGITMQANCRIFYEEVRASEVDILRITTNS
jgi:hypothetical protein